MHISEQKWGGGGISNKARCALLRTGFFIYVPSKFFINGHMPSSLAVMRQYNHNAVKKIKHPMLLTKIVMERFHTLHAHLNVKEYTFLVS